MKRKLAVQIFGAFVILAAVLAFYPATVYASRVIPVFVNGERVMFPDVHPEIRNERALVPVRGVFEHMGFDVQWNPIAHTATLVREADTISVRRDDNFFIINGSPNFPDVPPQIIEGRFMLPIRAIAEATGAVVRWDYTYYMVIITTTDGLPLPDPQAPPVQVAPPVITTLSLSSGSVGQHYSQALIAVGTNVSWDIISGSLPPGLHINANTGTITGSPTVPGTFTFTARAINSGGQSTANFTIVVQQLASRIGLPNRRLTDSERNAWIAEYRAMGGATAAELEIVRLINVERANHGLVHLQIDESLMMAARFFAQQANDLRGLYSGTHNFGPYATNINAQHGASANVAAAFGGNLNWNSGSWHSSGTISPSALVADWMASSVSRSFILSPEHRFIGVGQFPGGISYMFLSDSASTGFNRQATVSFNANGGTGTMAAQIFQQGATQALRANTFTRTGYTFEGWRGTTTGVAQYVDMQTITVTGNRTLYAVWRSTTLPSITTTSLANGIVGVIYNQPLAATGVTPMTWSVTNGSLPAGLVINENTGAIVGTPATAGTFNFTVRVQNAHGNSTRDFTIVVTTGAPVITTQSLANATIGVAYTTAPLAATGITPITWSVVSGSLPAGLTLNTNTGVISGTPAASAVTSTFTIRASNSSGNYTRQFTITMGVGVPAITTSSLPPAAIGAVYTTEPLAATGAVPITWNVIGGALPAGLNLNASTGIISGTPTTAGTFTFTVRAQNAHGNDTRVFTLTVNAGAPVITTQLLANATVGVIYATEPLAAAGATPITWSIVGGSLPAGLTLNANTGAISGTPTAVATTQTFTIRATNAIGFSDRQFTIVISAGAPEITTTELTTNIAVGASYNHVVAATGAMPMTWSISASSLPSGLSIDANTGAISGTPTVAGSFNFTVRVQNAHGTSTRQFTIIVNAGAPVITTASLANAMIGVAYSESFAATGAVPVTWSIITGSLPAGLSLNVNTGVISGTPTAAATTQTFTIRAQNASGNATREFTINIAAGAPVITVLPSADAMVGVQYSSGLAATGAVPITWSITGNLPAGLYINASTGVISGTPTTVGTFNFTIRATNASGSDTRQFTITVAAGTPVITTTSISGAATINVPFSSQPLAATGLAPISWAVTAGALPSGLTINGATGQISGTPTAAGTFNFTVSATNAIGTTTRQFTIVVGSGAIVGAPVITTSSITNSGSVNTPYNYLLTATGLTPMTWVVSGGRLPHGLTLQTNGQIIGTPTETGTFTFTARASNSAGVYYRTFTITIN